MRATGAFHSLARILILLPRTQGFPEDCSREYAKATRCIWLWPSTDYRSKHPHIHAVRLAHGESRASANLAHASDASGNADEAVERLPHRIPGDDHTSDFADCQVADRRIRPD